MKTFVSRTPSVGILPQDLRRRLIFPLPVVRGDVDRALDWIALQEVSKAKSRNDLHFDSARSHGFNADRVAGADSGCLSHVTRQGDLATGLDTAKSHETYPL